jgi:hypothetical protein
MKHSILIANGPCPAVSLAHGGENKLTPQTQSDPVEIAASGADTTKLKSLLARKSSGRFRYQPRSCGDSNKLIVMPEAVENFASVIWALPRPHLVTPRDETPIKFVSIDGIERYERGKKHPASRLW